MEAKPILIVKVDNYNNEFCELHELNTIIQDSFNDYHVLAVPFECKSEPIQFQTFYPKDIKEIDFEELKKLINNLNKTK